MFTVISKYAVAILGTMVGMLAVSLLVTHLYYKKVVTARDLDIAGLTTELVEERMNNSTLKHTIEDSNARAIALNTRLEEKRAEVVVLSNKPEKIRYHTIYKHVPEYVDMKVESCENTKAAVSAIRAANFNDID